MHALLGNIPCKLLELTKDGESTWEVKGSRHHCSIHCGSDGAYPVPKQHYFGKPPKLWLNLHQPKDVKKVRYWIERWDWVLILDSVVIDHKDHQQISTRLSDMSDMSVSKNRGILTPQNGW